MPRMPSATASAHSSVRAATPMFGWRHELEAVARQLDTVSQQPVPAPTQIKLQALSERLAAVSRQMSVFSSDNSNEPARIAQFVDRLAIRRCEAVILVHLLDHPDVGLTTLGLMDLIDTQSAGAVAVYISRLRSALRKAGIGDAIRSERQRGYWVAAEDVRRVMQIWNV